MNIVFITGITEFSMNKVGYETRVVNIDSSVVDNNFITPYLSLVESTLYNSLKDKLLPDSKYNVMFCGILDIEKNDFSILESEISDLKIEIKDEDVSLNPFF